MCSCLPVSGNSSSGFELMKLLYEKQRGNRMRPKITVLIKNNMKGILTLFYDLGTQSNYLQFVCAFYDSSGFAQFDDTLTVDLSTITTTAQFVSALKSAVLTAASGHGYSGFAESDIIFPMGFPSLAAGMVNAPQAAIANAPADANTSYNTVTTLLGALTGAVNTANSKQNDIATKLNSLLAELRTLGLISA